VILALQNAALPPCDMGDSAVFDTLDQCLFFVYAGVLMVGIILFMEWRGGGRDKYWADSSADVQALYRHSAQEEDSQALTYVLDVCVKGRQAAGMILSLPERMVVLAQRGALAKEIRRVQGGTHGPQT
jgi:hypothetical protein